MHNNGILVFCLYMPTLINRLSILEEIDLESRPLLSHDKQTLNYLLSYLMESKEGNLQETEPDASYFACMRA